MAYPLCCIRIHRSRLLTVFLITNMCIICIGYMNACYPLGSHSLYHIWLSYINEIYGQMLSFTKICMMTSSNGNIFRVTGHLCGESAQRPAWSFDVFVDLRLNGWVNNREAGDLRRYRAHCDITVMVIHCMTDYQRPSSVKVNHQSVIWYAFLICICPMSPM